MLFAMRDLHRRENPLLAVIAGPVELPRVHRRRWALKQSEHADALADVEPRVRLIDLHEDLPHESAQPLRVRDAQHARRSPPASAGSRDIDRTRWSAAAGARRAGARAAPAASRRWRRWRCHAMDKRMPRPGRWQCRR